MKSVGERDDLERAVLVFLAPFARQLDRAFVRLCAAGGEKNVRQSRERSQSPGECDGNVVEEGRTRVDQTLGLAHERAGYLRRTMTQRVDGPTLHEIEITLAAMIEEPRAVALDEYQLGARGNRHHGCGVVLIDLHRRSGSKKQKGRELRPLVEGCLRPDGLSGWVVRARADVRMKMRLRASTSGYQMHGPHYNSAFSQVGLRRKRIGKKLVLGQPAALGEVLARGVHHRRRAAGIDLVGGKVG